MCREILPHYVLDNTSIECIYVDLIYFAMFAQVKHVYVNEERKEGCL